MSHSHLLYLAKYVAQASISDHMTMVIIIVIVCVAYLSRVCIENKCSVRLALTQLCEYA